MTERIEIVADPTPMTRADTRMIEEYHEQQIASARRCGLTAREYHMHQYALRSFEDCSAFWVRISHILPDAIE